MSPMCELWSRGRKWKLAEFIDVLNEPTWLEEGEGCIWLGGVSDVGGMCESAGIRGISMRSGTCNGCCGQKK